MQNFPDSVVIVGAGVFGLSTALAINRRFPSTKVTVIDRHTPPVPDGTSVDTSRIIRPDYVDDHYEQLALKAQALIESDLDLRPHYHKHGFTFCTDGQPGEFEALWEQMLAKAKTRGEASYDELRTPEAVFRHLNGAGAVPPSEQQLGRPRRWVKGYTSKRCATVNAAAMVKVYYERCRGAPNIAFQLGVPVDSLLYSADRSAVEGVVLEDGREVRADKTVLATGAWSARLVRLDRQMVANAVGIAYIRLAPDEYEEYKEIACHTNLATGFNLFTPIGGLLKVLRRAGGVRNTVALKDPESRGEEYRASYPRTALDDPEQRLPADFLESLREELREIAPRFAERVFEKTKFCWLEQTTNGEFLICPHPRFANLQLATGGSLHGWKFLPLLGEFVVDSMTGKLEEKLVQKWSWESKVHAKMGKFGFMTEGASKELSDVVGAPRDAML